MRKMVKKKPSRIMADGKAQGAFMWFFATNVKDVPG